jgi:hypothetical protein
VHRPTEQTRALVAAMVVNGVPQTDIAKAMKVDPKTLRKCYRESLDHGTVLLCAKVVRNLVRIATTFSIVGIQPGTELQLAKANEIVCTTVDDVNQVEFQGDITSLSDAALQAIRGLGYEWDTASGPWEWTFQGKRLDDIRREIEEKMD